MKLTEDQTIDLLMVHLTKEGWEIDSYCLGQRKGCDIVALKPNTRLLIEVKGARASDNSPTKKREYFNSGQLKNHFGKAIVKILDDRYKNPTAQFAIAHPDDPAIRTAIQHLLPPLKTLEISHYWVRPDGIVTKE